MAIGPRYQSPRAAAEPPNPFAPPLARTGRRAISRHAEDARAGDRTMLKLALYILGGALLGFAYHRLVGCRSGACLITANPYVSTLYGAVMGYLLSGGLR